MTLIIKICFLALVCCTIIALSSGNSNEEQEQREWKSFLLSHTIDPDVNPKYRSWSTENWLELLKRRDALNRDLCSDCVPLMENELNTIFVATEKDIIEAFSQRNEDSNKSNEAWSRKPFQTYTIIEESVYDCGLQHIYAEVNKEGIPTDLLGLSDSLRQVNPTEINASIKCSQI